MQGLPASATGETLTADKVDSVNTFDAGATMVHIDHCYLKPFKHLDLLSRSLHLAIR